MIRFKVVRASKLLLYAAIAVLVAVLCFIAVRYALSKESQPRTASASLVEREAETQSVFASSDVAVPEAEPIEVEVVGEEPRSVLIYHTHTHEAYEQVADDPYEALEAWRTADAVHSVLRVGEELARCLRDEGFEVIHDTTDHENEALSTAYTRSLDTLESYDRAFDLYIDLHRDAWSPGMQNRYTDPDGTPMAQPMLLIGNGEGFDVKPHYEENLAFAWTLTQNINADHPGLCKDVLVKDGRYNQHIGIFAVLIEFGHNKNTLREALNTAPVVAEAIRKTLDDPEIVALMPSKSTL